MDFTPEVWEVEGSTVSAAMGDQQWEVWLPPGVGYGKSTEDVFRYKGSGAGLVIRRSAVPLIGLNRCGPASDHEFLLEAIRQGTGVRFCRINLYHHPIHEQSYVNRLRRDYKRHDYRLAVKRQR